MSVSSSKKIAKNVNIEIENLNLPDNFYSTVKERMNENNYNVKSQIWVNTKSKDNISNSSDTIGCVNNLEDTQKAVGLISYDKKTIYNSARFKNVLETIIKDSNQLDAKIVNLDSISNPKKWIQNISSNNNILCLQQDNTNIFINVEGNIVLNQNTKEYVPVLNIIDNGLKKGSDSDEEIKKIKKVQDLKHHIPESQYLSFKRRYELEIIERDKNERKRQKLQKTWIYPVVSDKYGLGWKRVSILCNTVIRKDFNHRKKNLWLHGNSGLGKTKYFLDILILNLNCYPIMKDKIQNTLYEGPYDLIYCDEFKAQKSAVFLNELCNKPSEDGTLIRLPGGANSVKYDSPPVIIVSQSDIDTIYKNEKNKQIIQALKNRFYEIQIKERGNIFEIEFDNKESDQLDSFIKDPNSYDESLLNDKEFNALCNIEQENLAPCDLNARNLKNQSGCCLQMNSEDVIDLIDNTRTSKKEEECRVIFQGYLKKEFPKVKHLNIINPETNRPLHLDGYNKEMKIAFEYHGYQHYVFPNNYHETEDEHNKQVARDKFKLKRCQELGIRLIVVPYTEDDHLYNFIINQLKQFDC